MLIELLELDCMLKMIMVVLCGCKNVCGMSLGSLGVVCFYEFVVVGEWWCCVICSIMSVSLVVVISVLMSGIVV